MSVRMTACPECHCQVRVTIPAGGDGTVEVYYRHDRPDGSGERCPESRQDLRTSVYE